MNRVKGVIVKNNMDFLTSRSGEVSREVYVSLKKQHS